MKINSIKSSLFPVIQKNIKNSTATNNTVVLTPFLNLNSNYYQINFAKKIYNNEIESYSQLPAYYGTEAKKRITSEYKYPRLNDINAFMVSAETEDFMKTGGLGTVSTQLPDAFNILYSNDKNNYIKIVTPLYVGKDHKGNQASITPKTGCDDTFIYTGQSGSTIELKKVDSLPVKMYNDSTEKYENNTVDVLTGKFGNSEYIFLRNDEIFNIIPSEDNLDVCSGPYVSSTSDINEQLRMAFFSKAVYKLLTKEGNTAIEKPNLIIANDWHASPISALFRFLAPLEKLQGKISEDAYRKIETTPIIHIVHNSVYQGIAKDSRTTENVQKTLFEDNNGYITSKIRDMSDRDAPYKNGEFINLAKYNINLADRVVAVSPNYAKELPKEDFGLGLENVFKTRKSYNTLLGIVNGYDKKIAAPSSKMIDSINDSFQTKEPFVSYDDVSDESMYQLKMLNKKATISLLSDLINRTNAHEKFKFTIHNAKWTQIDNIKNPLNVPIISTVGRFTDQKGFDIFADSMLNTIKKLKHGQEPPIFIVLGSGDEEIIKKLLDVKQQVSKFNKKASERIIIIEGFSAQLRDAISIGSDFFAIPSKWEPCGLTQEEVMAKGTLPVATATGGLVDTIENNVDGFLTSCFYGNKTGELICQTEPTKAKNNFEAYNETLKKALDTFYNDKNKIKKMSLNAYKKDFSWEMEDGPLEKYISLFKTGSIDNN